MTERTVCFSGHRPEKLPYGGDENHPFTAELKSMLHLAIREAAEAGYTRFISGMARGVDLWACESVLALAREFPTIKLVCALPYADCGHSLHGLDRVRFNSAVEKASETVILAEAYSAGCLRARNAWMVEQSSRLIAVCTDMRSGTGQTIRLARKGGLSVRLISVER